MTRVDRIGHVTFDGVPRGFHGPSTTTRTSCALFTPRIMSQSALARCWLAVLPPTLLMTTHLEVTLRPAIDFSVVHLKKVPAACAWPVLTATTTAAPTNTEAARAAVLFHTAFSEAATNPAT